MSIQISEGAVGRKLIGYVITDLADDVACKAGETANRTGIKLACIMSSSRTEGIATANEPKEDEEYPDYFAALRTKLIDIVSSLNTINAYLDRVEL